MTLLGLAHAFVRPFKVGVHSVSLFMSFLKNLELPISWNIKKESKFKKESKKYSKKFKIKKKQIEPQLRKNKVAH